jgi:excisionase family DNA binding protein
MKKDDLRFEDLPKKVLAIYTIVNGISKKLNDHLSLKNEMTDDLLTIEQASEFTSLAKQTIYQLVSERRIPFIKRKGSKRLYFSRIDLREWILTGRKNSK